MKPKGLTITMIFEAGSANYGEAVGNVSALKKVARNNGEQYTYISRQAIRYNIVEQLNRPLAEVSAEGSSDKKVIQFHKDATIEKYPELDFFGYLKTVSKKDSKEDSKSGGKKRSAKVRLSNAVSLETFKGDLDFLTNKGLADRMKENMNIAQSEIHQSYYSYTMTVDLDQIGIDEVEEIHLSKEEKTNRMLELLDTVSMLYRDIRGRREDLKPLFAIGGVYDVKNPVFQNAVEVRNNSVNIGLLQSILPIRMKEQTACGLVEGKFANDKQLKAELGAVSMPQFFEKLKEEVQSYYESC